MPNHIKNRIFLVSNYEQSRSLFEKYATSYPAKLNLAYDNTIICRKKDSNEFSVGWFDPHAGTFRTRENGVCIGLPEDWEFEINEAFNHFPDFKKIISPPDDPAYRDEPNQEIAMKSPNWWHEWNCNNWGTKWNSNSSEEENYNSFLFETAWNGVPKLILEISKQNPDIEIHYEFADEDTGYNCGSYKFLNGNTIYQLEPKGGTKEAYDIAFRLRPDQKRFYKLIDGNYQYNEDSED